MSKVRTRPARRPQPSLTLLERMFLTLQNSAAARVLSLLALTIPAFVALSIFWWNVRVSAQKSVANSPAPTPSATELASATAPVVPTAAPVVAPSVKLAPGMLMPAEFERQDGMILGTNELVEFHPQVLVAMVSAMAGKLELYGLVNDGAQRQKVVSLLEENKLPLDAIRLIELPAYGMWVRDYGPKFLRNSVGGLTMVDFAYLDRPATDGTVRPQDDRIPSELSKLFRTPVVPMPLSMEGGNLLVNGCGLCVTTVHLLAENSHRNYGLTDIGTLLHETYGQQQWSRIEFLNCDQTKHADTYVTFAAPNVAVVASCDKRESFEDAGVMDRTAEQLAKEQTPLGPMRVVRIPMTVKGDNVVRTYTNVVYANGTLLVPQYSDVDSAVNERALQIYREILPDWEIVPIECLSIAKSGGALHCVTCNVPSPSMAPLVLTKK